MKILLEPLESVSSRRSTGVKCGLWLLIRYHHAVSPPPSRVAGPHDRPSSRRERRTQELLSRLEVVDPAYQKAPLRLRQVLHRGEPAIMEGHVSRPFLLPRVPHAISIHQMPSHRHDYKRRRGRFDIDIFSGCAFGSRHAEQGPRSRSAGSIGDFSCPVPWILVPIKIPLHELSRPPTFAVAQFHYVIPSSRGHLFGHLLRRPGRRRCLRWATDHHQTFNPTLTYRMSEARRMARDGSYRTPIAIPTE